MALSFPESKSVRVLLERDKDCWVRNLKQRWKTKRRQVELKKKSAAGDTEETDHKKIDNAKAVEMESLGRTQTR